MPIVTPRRPARRRPAARPLIEDLEPRLLLDFTPDSLIGRTTTLTITAASGAYPSSGTILFAVSSAGDTYYALGRDGAPDSFGTYTYAISSPTTAQIDTLDAASHVSAANQVTFTSATAGTFAQTSVAGTLQGTLTITAAPTGTAPAAIAGQQLQFQISAGHGQSAATGSYTVTTTSVGNSYVLLGSGGVANSSGTYLYQTTTAPTAISTSYDTVSGAVNTELTFLTNTAGSFLLGNSTTDSWQIGTFSIGAPVASQLAFAQPPSDAAVGAAFSPAVAVKVEDAAGNLVTADSTTVLLAAAGGSGTLQGTLSAPVVNGIATFSNLTLSAAGTYTLQATDGSYAPASSGSFTITAPAHLVATGPDAGSTPLVKVFDAATGNLYYSFYAYNQDFVGAVRVATGDFNGDGIPDIVTATGPGGQPLVTVHDGKTGTMICNFYAYNADYLGGVEVAVADVTGSGHPDIITSTDAGGMPLVNVFNSTGTLLLNFYAYDPNYLGGVRIASGDFIGDGKAEIVTSTANGGQPLVNVFNWVGSLVGNFWGDDPSYTGGLQIAVGNFAADGIAKVATYRDQASAAQVKLFNLSTQQQFATITLADPTLPLQLRLAAVNLTGGIADLVTVPRAGNPPEVEIFSATDGSLIRQWSAYASSVTCGLFVAAE